MERIFCIISGVSGFIAVGLGAFGAHALKSKLSPEMMATYQTGVQYHLVHTLAITAAAFAIGRWSQSMTHVAGWLFVAGIVLFSGSLYVLALTGSRALVYATPVGGLCFLAGWLLLAWTGLSAD